MVTQQQNNYGEVAPAAHSDIPQRHYRHPPREPHPSAEPTTKTTATPERFRTVLCNKWAQTGHCPYQYRCMFAHGPRELRMVDDNIRDGLTTAAAIQVFKRQEKAAALARKRAFREREQQQQQDLSRERRSPSVSNDVHNEDTHSGEGNGVDADDDKDSLSEVEPEGLGDVGRRGDAASATEHNNHTAQQQELRPSYSDVVSRTTGVITSQKARPVSGLHISHGNQQQQQQERHQRPRSPPTPRYQLSCRLGSDSCPNAPPPPLWAADASPFMPSSRVVLDSTPNAVLASLGEYCYPVETPPLRAVSCPRLDFFLFSPENSVAIHSLSDGGGEMDSFRLTSANDSTRSYPTPTGASLFLTSTNSPPTSPSHRHAFFPAEQRNSHKNNKNTTNDGYAMPASMNSSTTTPLHHHEVRRGNSYRHEPYQWEPRRPPPCGDVALELW